MITKQQFDSLFSFDITKKQYDAIIQQIDERFEEICEKFLRKTNSSAWYVYGNLSYKDENSEGFFDPEEYKEHIEIGGEYINPPPGYGLSFPTRWLWEESWEEEMQKTVEDYKKLVEVKKGLLKQQREERKLWVKALKASIREKLTPDELKIVKFKL